MTLAAFLLLATSWTMSPQAMPAAAPTATQSAPHPSSPAPEKQDQSQSNAPVNGSSEAKPQSPSDTTPRQGATAKRRHRKKKPAAVNCDTATTTPSGAANAGTGGSTAAPDPATPSAAGSATASKNCPPTKIIVRHGGISEPSIQLAPSTDQSAKQRDVVSQLLGATDANLKRIAGKQLSTNQQNVLGQIRAYQQQSRAAVSDGDLERARTLAWKAELLSEDLIKPEK